MSLEISPVPSDEEAAAIAAALVVGWPTVAAEVEAGVRRPPAWRFAGRWWGGPVAVERARPWRR